MKYYVIINGNSSLDIQGLAIESLPNISKPLIRTTREEIDGRDGDIITKLGYSAYDKTLNIGLWGNYDINEVIAFFNEEGVITFSNEPDKYYKFHILNRIDFVNQLEKFKKASITIHCQPFKYKEQEAKVIEEEAHTTSGTSFNLSDTLEAPLLINLKGNTSQTGTPTPSSPKSISVVSGNNDIQVCGKNRFDKSTALANTYINHQGNEASASGYSCSLYIKVSPNTTYTASNDSGSIFQISEYTKDKVFIERNVSSTSTRNYFTKTTTATTEYIRLAINTLTLDKLMLELGNQPSTYEPYTSATYNIDLPVENVLGLTDGTYSSNGIEAIVLNGKITLNGTATGGNSFIEIPRTTINMINGDKYSISINNPVINPNVRVRINPTGLYDTIFDTTNKKNTITFNSSYPLFTGIIGIRIVEGTQLTNFELQPQFEKGTQFNSYTPYGTTPIELNKIGTYQDYIYKENDKWYLHKEIGKVVLNGSENWSGGAFQTSYRYKVDISDANTPSRNNIDLYSNHFVGSVKVLNTQITTGEMAQYTGTKSFYFSSSETSSDNFKTWLSNNNTTLYYQLGTATNTEITYTPLIEQLNTLEEAQSYEGTTNINQVNNDLPFIIDLTYYTGDTSITITNDGNIYSKPLLELKGTGNINIYLNGIQVFVVSLNNEIIYIDTDKMEAYYQGTLKNRQVVGDYNNFKLQSGNNTIQVDGGYVEYLKITNYSRWV